jgi:hypothetical protein
VKIILNSELFATELSYLKNDNLRLFISQCLNKLPDYFRHIGASTSGKYHPSYTLGEGGLIKHTKAAVGIALQLFRADIYDIKEDEKDIVVSALLLHDGLKCGMWEDKTAFNHPILMKDFILKKYNENHYDIEFDIINKISNCVASHMGKWNTQDGNDLILPTPQTQCEKMVHLCDYLASRKCLIYDFDTDVEAR